MNNFLPPSGELLRICSKTYEEGNISSEMFPTRVKLLLKCTKALIESNRLQKYASFDSKEGLFSIDAAFNDIITVKRIKLTKAPPVFTKNLLYCLHGLRLINISMVEIENMKKSTFSATEEKHITMLVRLWNTMKPESPRKNMNRYNYFTEEWEKLGFQASDPTTDLRGMGILGLYQLVYFSHKRTLTAKTILEESHNTSKVAFPFAVTGINITSFILELLTEGRLHLVYINNYESAIHSVGGCIDDASNNQKCIDYFVNIIHDIYCIVFEEFYLLWVVRKPKELMEFNSIFEEMKSIVRNKYPPFRQDKSSFARKFERMLST